MVSQPGAHEVNDGIGVISTVEGGGATVDGSSVATAGVPDVEGEGVRATIDVAVRAEGEDVFDGRFLNIYLAHGQFIKGNNRLVQLSPACLSTAA